MPRGEVPSSRGAAARWGASRCWPGLRALAGGVPLAYPLGGSKGGGAPPAAPALAGSMGGGRRRRRGPAASQGGSLAAPGRQHGAAGDRPVPPVGWGPKEMGMG